MKIIFKSTTKFLKVGEPLSLNKYLHDTKSVYLGLNLSFNFCLIIYKATLKCIFIKSTLLNHIEIRLSFHKFNQEEK